MSVPATQRKGMEPAEALSTFYEQHGIRTDDLEAKLRVMQESVQIPDSPRCKELYLLEKQWYEDNGYSV